MAEKCRDAAAGFDHEKAAQITAFFVKKAGAGGIEKLKLIKLIYLAQRLYLERFGTVMNFDEFFSLPHGPIASSALNGINGELDHPAWKAIHADPETGTVITTNFEGDFDHLSRADISILEEVWGTFRNLSASQIRNYTHRNCPEYTELLEGRIPISIKEILDAVGNADALAVADEIESMRKAFARLPAEHAD